MKSILSKILLAGIITFTQFADLNLACAQVIHSESFDSTAFPPSGWTRTGGGGSLWVRRTNGNNPMCTPHSGAAMARFSVGMVPPGTQETLTSPVVDFSGASGSIPTFSLWIYRDGGNTAGDSLTVSVNTTNSTTGAVRIGAVARSRFFFLPHNELADGWYNYTFNVPASFNTNTNYFLLTGTTRGGKNIFVDDVQWIEYLTPCSGTPTAGFTIAADSVICGGSGSTQLSLSGNNTGGGLTYQWQTGSSNIGPWTNFGTNTSVISTGTISASAWYRCYITCANGAASDTSAASEVVVSPNPNPVVTINLGTTVNFCSGNTPLVLVANGAATYTWNPNIASNTVGDSALASPAFNTSYTVIGSDSLGCSGSASIAVTVAQSPIVTATITSDTICSGQQVTIHAQVQGGGFGTTYLWQPGGLTGATHIVTPSVPTTYTVGATSNFSGCTGYDSVSVYVYASPVSGFTYTVNNMTYTFTDTSTGGVTSWLWNFGDGNTDNTQNPVHTYTANGNYTVTLTVSNGNCSNTFTIPVVVLAISKQLSNGSELLVFPNPVSDITTVQFTYNEPSVVLDITNTLGQSVLSKTLYPISGNNFKTDLDMSVFSKGIYLMQIKTKTENVSMQLMKD
jgi:PKD repeat protein